MSKSSSNSNKKYKICFFCEDELFIVNLENIYNNPDYSIKCKKCNKPIDFKKGLFRTKNEKIYFKCEKCINKNSASYSKIIDHEATNENTILNKLEELKNVKDENQKTQFYNENLKEVLELEKFINYVLIIVNILPKNSKENEIINNFLNYFNYLIDISLKYSIIYEIYHFKKECNIYGDDYKNKFMSKKFQYFYNALIKRCFKKKCLSIEMLKYIHQKLFDLKLALPLNIYLQIDESFFKEKKRDIHKDIVGIFFDICNYYSEF